MLSIMKKRKEGQWAFPGRESGDKTFGLNDSGIHSYSANPNESLAREICQNSLDAKADTDKPVKVEFSSFEIKPEDIPGQNELLQVYRNIENFYESKKKHDQKEKEFVQHARRTLNKTAVPCLRISDYNTTGLEDSDKQYSGKWYYLVKAEGHSDKTGAAGGSFGIGKNAVFAYSNLHLVFYATKAQDGLKAFQGVTKIASFEDDKGKLHSPTGFFGTSEDFGHIKKWHSLDPNFQTREEYGTDIFILGAKRFNNWKESIILTILNFFFISILEGKLEVKVDDVEITSDTLGQIFSDYRSKLEEDDKNNRTLQFYDTYIKAANNPDKLIFKETIFEQDDVELRVYFDNGLSRRAAVTRQNGMIIFEKARISTAIDFAAVLILRGDQVNGFFKKLETPQHDKWSVDMVDESERKKAERYRKKLFAFVREIIKDHADYMTKDRIDPQGLSDFLPDLENDPGDEEKAETLSEYKIKSLNINTPRDRSPSHGSSEEDMEKERKTRTTPDEDGEERTRESRRKRRRSKKKNFKVPGVEDEEGREGLKIIPITPHTIRIIPTAEGYRIHVRLKEAVQSLGMNFKYQGEERNRTRPIHLAQAALKEPSSKKAIAEKNGIRIDDVAGEKNFKLDVTLKQNMKWAFKVELAELQEEVIE